MDEILEEFEAYVYELDKTMRAGGLAGTDDELTLDQADDLVEEYRAKLAAEIVPSRRRELFERFKEEAERL
jgi:hypothetical protein